MSHDEKSARKEHRNKFIYEKKVELQKENAALSKNSKCDTLYNLVRHQTNKCQLEVYD